MAASISHHDSINAMQEASPRSGKKKEARKKGVTCLRNKSSQYGELNQALDFLLDGSSQNQLPVIQDLSSKYSSTLDPAPRQRYLSNTAQKRKTSICLKEKADILSPIRGAGSGIVSSTNRSAIRQFGMLPEEQNYNLGNRKQKMLSKFFELSTAREPQLPRAYHNSYTMESSKVT